MSARHIPIMASLMKRWVEQNFLYNFKNSEIGLNQSIRHRFTIAQVNAGATLLPAIRGFGYRMLSCRAISIGGAVGATTTVDILATLAGSSRKLVAYAQASLTQSAVLGAGSAAGAVLADGASFTVNDANTAITINVTGIAGTVATHIDIIFDYVVQKA